MDEVAVSVIGGGLAGTAAAIKLANGGWPVHIMERDTFPRNKLCGEFLSGESRRLLNELGCLDKLLRHDPPEIRQARFISRRGRILVAQLPTPALGISRRLLDETLFNHALSASAKGTTGAEVTGLIRNSAATDLTITTADGATTQTRSKIVIGAYGRRSRLDRDLDRNFLKSLDRSVALKLHHHIPETVAGSALRRELADTTEVYGLQGGYCGITMVENGVVNVCMLLSQKAFAQIGTSSWPAIATFLARENPALGRRLEVLQPTDEPVLTISQMPFTRKNTSSGNILFVGDAGGMIAPMCGDGMAMALQSGIMAADLVMSHYKSPDTDNIQSSQLGKLWDAQWHTTFAKRIRVGKVLQSLLLSPRAAEASMALLNRSPAAVKALTNMTRGI